MSDRQPLAPPQPVNADPEGPQPLHLLLEQARAPTARRKELQALLHGLSQPLGSGEDARARADLLHTILRNKRLRSFLGSDGRRMNHVASQAMVALGPSYALELQHRAPNAALPHALTFWQELGRGLAIALGALEALCAVVLYSQGGLGEFAAFIAGFITLIASMAAYVALEEGLHAPVLNAFCRLLVALPILSWLGAAFGFSFLMHGKGAWSVMALGCAFARFMTALSLHASPPPEPEPE